MRDTHMSNAMHSSRRSNYTNHAPDYITRDLSIGYNTGDLPANDHLNRIGLPIMIQDVLDKHSSFAHCRTM